MSRAEDPQPSFEEWKTRAKQAESLAWKRSIARRLEEAGNTVQEARQMLDGADRVEWETQRVLKRAEREIDRILEELL